MAVESTLGSGTTFRVRLPFGYSHLPPAQVKRSTSTAPIASMSSGTQSYSRNAQWWLPAIDLAQATPKLISSPPTPHQSRSRSHQAKVSSSLTGSTRSTPKPSQICPSARQSIPTLISSLPSKYYSPSASRASQQSFLSLPSRHSVSSASTSALQNLSKSQSHIQNLLHTNLKYSRPKSAFEPRTVSPEVPRRTFDSRKKPVADKASPYPPSLTIPPFFDLALKSRSAPTLPTLPKPYHGPEKRRYRVLLADDNADMRNYVARLLSDKYDVIAVSNGKLYLFATLFASLYPHSSLPGLEALKIAEQNKGEIDLVLTDVMMPYMDGFTLLKELR